MYVIIIIEHRWMWRIFFIEKPNGFSFFCSVSPQGPWQDSQCSGQHCCWGFSGVVFSPRARDSEHAGWGLCRQFPTAQPSGLPPWSGSSFSCLPHCPSPPAVLSGVSQYPLGPPQGTGSPGIQPVAPTLPHEAPSDPSPTRVLKTVRRGERTREPRELTVEFYLFIFCFLFFVFLLSLPVSEIRTDSVG